MKRLLMLSLLVLALAVLAGSVGAPAIQAAPAICTGNVAIGDAAFSDTVSPGSLPANAVDGAMGTWWQSSNTVNTSGARFWVDLGTATNFLAINIYWWEAPSSLSLEISNNGTDWTTLAKPTVGTNNVTHWGGSATARYVRMSATHTNTLDGTVAISEFAIMSPSACPTTAKVTSSANPSVYGQPVTFTTTLTASDGSLPQGTVDFSVVETSTALCTGIPVLSGKASCAAKPPFPAGTYTIQATYNSANGWLTSGNSLTQTVNKANTRTTLTSSSPTVSGQPVTFTATVSTVAPGAGMPDGTVDFVANGNALCTAVSLSAGKAICKLNPGLLVGTWNVQAIYSGSSNFKTSGGGIALILKKATTKTTVTASPLLVNPGDAVTLTAKVTVRTPGLPVVPGGVVIFKDNSVAIPGCNSVNLDSSFQATCGPLVLPSGRHAITAVYGGSAQYIGSSGSLVGGLMVRYTPVVRGQILDKLNHVITSAAVGTVVHDKAIVSGGHGTPTGSVTFNLYYTTDCSGAPAAQQTLNLNYGQVQSGIVTQPPSGLSFQISYNGNGIYAPTTGTCQALPVP